MFSEQTEREIVNAMTPAACGMLVTLTPWAYRELLDAARRWDAVMSGPRGGAWISLVPEADGSLAVSPGGHGVTASGFGTIGDKTPTVPGEGG